MKQNIKTTHLCKLYCKEVYLSPQDCLIKHVLSAHSAVLFTITNTLCE